jgi:hypothetical protein
VSRTLADATVHVVGASSDASIARMVVCLNEVCETVKAMEAKPYPTIPAATATTVTTPPGLATEATLSGGVQLLREILGELQTANRLLSLMVPAGQVQKASK